MTQLQAAIVAWAQSYIGTKETAPNSGPDIDGWLMLLHGTPGQPWCAAFASCAVLCAADECGIEGLAFHPSIGTQRLWAANMALQVQEPMPGDIYVLRHTASTGHAGIVETVENGEVVSEVSGNTFADGGGREGDSVARHFGSPDKTHGGVLLGFLRVG